MFFTMAFTPEQDAFILMAHFRSATHNQDGSWTYSLQSCIDQFVEQFPGEDILYDTISHQKHMDYICRQTLSL